MKTIGYLIATFLLLSNAVCAQESAGIRFFTGSWKAVLAEAKRLNKPVFVDIYTTWCGPCKQMAKQAFPDPTVGKTFNANFINYQIDAEKGEGIALANTYTITAYPTSLYVNSNGDLIQRTVGYAGIPGMLTEAQKAIAAANDPNAKVSLSQESADKSRDPVALAAYLAERTQQYLPDGKALDAYLTLIPEADWTTDANLKLIAGNITASDSKAFQVLLDSVSTIRANPAYMTSPVMQKKVQTFAMPLMKVCLRQLDHASTEADMERAIPVFLNLSTTISGKPAVAADQEKGADVLRRQFYLRTKNTDKYRPLASAEANRLMAMSVDSVRARNEVTARQLKVSINALPDSLKSSAFASQLRKSANTAETTAMSFFLTGLAWSYYELMTDVKDLNQALTWSARALEYSRDAHTLHTHAHLLNKLGRKADAIKTQEEAIVTAKVAGDDTTVYEKGLADLKQP